MVDLVFAVALDLMIGDPPDFPHPIRLMGNLIALEEKLVRRYATSRKNLVLGGLFMVIINYGLVFGLSWGLLILLRPYPYLSHPVAIYLLYTCLAARCLRDEALKVYHALRQGLEEARLHLSYIVGRETKHLDEPEIIRATVETVAENTADGVIAPLLYAMLGGVPLALLYKMGNTMDSMVGYMTPQYKDIGFFPAKIDDGLNYIPARLTGILMNLGGLFRFPVLEGFRVMMRDRKNHKSPNCAYPEGAMAGLLGIRLGGDNVYFGQVIKKPTIGDARKALEQTDILRAIEVMFRTEILCMLLYLLISTWTKLL